MNAVVQLVRNFLCCVKDLEILKGTVLYDASYFASLHGLDYPYYKTTPLEALISVCQFYVFLTGVPAAWTLFWISLGKLKRIQRILERKHRQPQVPKISVEKLMLQSLVKEATMALKSAYVGFNIFFISFAFLWLTANSWHITETPLMGGLPALIHALTVMNICLTPLLYYMYKDANAHLRNAHALETAERHWMKRGAIAEKNITLPILEALTGWRPFWESGAPIFGGCSVQQEQDQWKREGENLQKLLDGITGKALKKKKSDDDDDDGKPAEEQTNHTNEMAEKLHVRKRIVRLEGYREYFFLLVNTIAWYGYGVCILVYYYPIVSEQPSWLRLILAYSKNNHDVDWRGNFMGDLMWTIEPLVILTSPLYLSGLQLTIQTSMKQRNIKTKED